MTPPEAGCYLAFERFQNNIQRAILYVDARTFAPAYSDPKRLKIADMLNPRLFSNNLLLPYLVSAIEDYFKSTFVALAKHSDAKETLFRNARITADRLVTVAAGEARIEEVVADAMSFQSLAAICNHFRAADKRIDYAGVLRRPVARRSLYGAVEVVIARRHALIHHSELDLAFEDSLAARAIDDVFSAVRKCHEHLLSVEEWTAAKDKMSPAPWSAKKRLRLRKTGRGASPAARAAGVTGVPARDPSPRGQSETASPSRARPRSLGGRQDARESR